MSYTLQLDALERETLAYIGVAGTMLAQGAEGVEFPSFAETKAQFDEWLLSEVEVGQATDMPDQVMRRALGIKER